MTELLATVPATATIITLNEAEHIADCVKSVAFFDEVLVVDSGSTDNTVELARAAGATVIENTWPGFGPQKQFALEQARNHWIFSIDADERVTEDLKKSIQKLFSNRPRSQGYTVNRRNHFMGRALRHGEGYPDWCLRLFDRRHASWSEDPVHEKVELWGRIVRLSGGDLEHFSELSLSEYMEKQNQYTTIQARHMFEAGRRAPIYKLVLSPFVRFLKFYVLRLGFLDGIPGLVHITVGCYNSFLKYAKLREIMAAPATSRPAPAVK